MEKRKFPYISFIASIMSMVGLIILSIMVLVVYIKDSTMESSYGNMTPLVGILIMFYPIIALYGLISSWYCAANATVLWARRAAFVMLGVSVAVLFPFCAMLLGLNDVAWVIVRIVTWFANLFIG